jgi:hypothetical protein
MSCALCKTPAEEMVLFKKESNSEPGFISIGENVSFENDEVEKFVYFAETHGCHLEREGMLELCHQCLIEAKRTLLKN